MTNKHKSGETALGALVLAYIQSSHQARTDRHRTTKQAQYLVAREKEITARTRMQADVDITREREVTQREAMRCRAQVEITREQRIAFESLCNALKSSLRSGEISLENIRHQFGSICQLMIEKDVLPAERTILFGLLNELLGQQKQIAAGNLKALEQIRPERYLSSDAGKLECG